MNGLIISAAASGSGKTTVMLGLARAFSRSGLSVQAFKSGPDYIDPAFHTAATGRASVNLDSWAMGRDRIAGLITGHGGDLVLAEGSMGLFDGVARAGACGNGATADLAEMTGWPVVLVVDASGAAQTAAAAALGLARFRPNVRVAGVILNRVASPRHEALLRVGMQEAGLQVFGCLPRNAGTVLPERHLGLIQAEETADLQSRLDTLADLAEAHLDLPRLRNAARPSSLVGASRTVPAPAGRIALARDAAFSFVYPHLIAGWRAAGVTILPFSPLADEGPDDSADLCWLPGGYPELHAPRLAACSGFRTALRQFAETRPVHGECGGYMAMGAGLVAADGVRYEMAGLLGLETSFAKRRMNLGYRHATLDVPHLPRGVRGHEFHYATILDRPDAPLAHVTDANGDTVSETGSRRDFAGGGIATGTFFHMIAEDA
ncbi:cobyrinate a,c-diamide synthase [Falsirhodobacter sp. alg1]|uniref:cobyrinate a,c-diamide synthase n=1 Tax=Falsirhodobacter sp. alg1 TaxID=1472418 RepID=UPI0005EE1652|nr:cobyrinate a,c-diamide synthase [Falsirhodobacter sp. alg1]